MELKKKVDAKQLQLANINLEESTLWMKLKTLKEEVEEMKVNYMFVCLFVCFGFLGRTWVSDEWTPSSKEEENWSTYLGPYF